MERRDLACKAHSLHFCRHRSHTATIENGTHEAGDGRRIQNGNHKGYDGIETGRNRCYARGEFHECTNAVRDCLLTLLAECAAADGTAGQEIEY